MVVQEDVDMTGPAEHLQMELCSPKREMCRQQNLVPAFIKFRSSHAHSTDDFPQRRVKELLALTMRDQCFMNPLQSSETTSTGKIHCAKEKKTPHITLFWEVFLFCLVTVHIRTVLWATWAARWGCGRATGHLPGQGRRDNHGTWPTPAPGAPAQPGSQRTSAEVCLRDSSTHSLGAATSKRVMKIQKEPQSSHPGLIVSAAIN